MLRSLKLDLKCVVARTHLPAEGNMVSFDGYKVGYIRTLVWVLVHQPYSILRFEC